MSVFPLSSHNETRKLSETIHTKPDPEPMANKGQPICFPSYCFARVEGNLWNPITTMLTNYVDKDGAMQKNEAKAGTFHGV